MFDYDVLVIGSGFGAPNPSWIPAGHEVARRVAATISGNLGVNPSLTITALAERAVSLWPSKGERDPRPPVGAPYRRLAPVVPIDPVVPERAPGALRLPITPA